jgi:RNA polymerase sigma-70 factor (sigma-E family)
MTFEVFAAAEVRPLLGLASAMSGDPGLAEDLVQEVLFKAHRRWRSIEKLDMPSGYVRRMLVNEFLSWRRKWARVVPTAEIEFVDDAPDHATAHADRQALAAALTRLPSRHRAVLAMRYYGGLSDTEIADVLGCRVTTVRAYISRALATLRSQPTALLTTNTAGDPAVEEGM